MPSEHGKCHCGDDELWLSLDDLLEVVNMAVDHRLGFDGQGGALAKDKIRARLEGRRGAEGQADDPAPRM